VTVTSRTTAFTPFWWSGATTVLISAFVDGSGVSSNTFARDDVVMDREGVSYQNGSSWGPGFIPWSHIVNVIKVS